jgi:tetraacyldisaccharide 4'-kinase
MKTPSFWYDNSIGAKLTSFALTPFSWIYGAAANVHKGGVVPYRAKIPVICVGNLTAGGSGKTPIALSLMELVKEKRLATKPCFLSRGYGGTLQVPALVDLHKHTAADVGDEPLVLAAIAPVIISPDRAAGAQFAESNGMDLIIMDDGLQNPTLAKDLSLVVVDGASGFGNRRMIPAGPLREKLPEGLARADAFVVIGDDSRNLSRLLPANKPVLRARLEVPPDWRIDKSQNYLAFCGIGRPEKFRNTIEQLGLKLAGWQEFADHYPYMAIDLQRLEAEAAAKNARLLTTQKDVARFPTGFAWKNPPAIMPVKIVWQDENMISALLKENILNAESAKEAKNV